MPIATESATPLPSPSLLKKTGVKLQFIPPPMEGTISLGVYDRAGKLVRTLHKEATGDEFVAALDGYITHWDGLDDAGNKVSPGRYTARGYMVGGVAIRQVDSMRFDVIKGSTSTLTTDGTGAPEDVPVVIRTSGSFPLLREILESTSMAVQNGRTITGHTIIHIVLVPNPLDRDRAGNADLTAGIDASGSWLELADGLPLKRISATPGLKWIVLGRKSTAKPITVFQNDGQSIVEFEITKASNMMAFDCGPFDFPGK